jgi:hypothetical protein
MNDIIEIVIIVFALGVALGSVVGFIYGYQNGKHKQFISDLCNQPTWTVKYYDDQFPGRSKTFEQPHEITDASKDELYGTTSNPKRRGDK